MTDDQRSKNRRNWRGFTWDYAKIEGQEELSPTLHCLSATTRMLVLSMLDMIGWSTRYSVPYGESIDSDKIAAWEALAAYELSEGQMLRGVGCKLETSCDGVNWTTLIDFSDCMLASPSNDQVSITYETNIETTTNNYDGTPESIDAGDVVYDSTPDDDNRDTALCLAIRAYLEAIARTWVEKDQANDSRNRLIATAALIFASGVLAIMTAGVGNLIAGAVGTAIALAAINIDLEDETQLYADATLDEVQCCMYDALSGGTPTEQDFKDSAGSCDLSGYAADLATIANEVNQTHEAYLAFLKLWSESVAYADDGLISNECLTCGRWTKYWDFRNGIPQGWIVSIGFNNETFGELGSTGFDSNLGDTVTGVSIGFDMGITAVSALKQMRMEYDYEKSDHWDAVGNNQTNLRIGNVNPGKQILGNISSLIDDTGTDKELIWNGTQNLNATHWLNAQVVSSVEYNEEEYGSGKILGIYIEGDGTPPSWAD